MPYYILFILLKIKRAADFYAPYFLREMTEEEQLTAKELKLEILKDLKENGILDEMRSQLRKNVFQSLQKAQPLKKKSLNNRQILISTVISEWLRENGLHATLSTLEAESGLSETKLPPELTKLELGISNNSSTVLDTLIDTQMIAKKNGQTHPPEDPLINEIIENPDMILLKN